MGLNAAVQPLMFGPDKDLYKDFFLQAADGPEFTHTDCQQMGENPPNCVGWFWNFGNASARDYFVDHLVGPLAAAGTIDGVFFDAVNYGYDIPETRPWGRAVVSVPDCDGRLNVSGCDALVAGTIDVAARASTLLNALQDTMYATPVYYSNFYNRTIVLDEQRLVTALDGIVAQLLRVGACRAARRRPQAAAEHAARGQGGRPGGRPRVLFAERDDGRAGGRDAARRRLPAGARGELATSGRPAGSTRATSGRPL